jgi:hypothetical protein
LSLHRAHHELPATITRTPICGEAASARALGRQEEHAAHVAPFAVSNAIGDDRARRRLRRRPAPG